MSNQLYLTKDSNGYFKVSTTNTSGWWSTYWYISSDKSEQTYTLSGYNKKGTKVGHVVVRYYKSGTNNILVQKDVSEGYFTIKFTVPSGAETITVYLGISPTASGDYTYYKHPKLELGDKATDWTPAPEDVDSDISSVDTKVTTVSNQYTSLNQSLTSLTATVNSNTTKISKKADGSTVTALQANVTALTADLSGFKTSVSNIYATKTSLSDYATVTAMNSAITQSASSILTTVSSNYATKASLELKVDKDKLISEINASADVITLKSNRFVLDSTNAKIAADGTVNFVQGTIAGWNISSTRLSGSAGLYGISLNKPASTSTKVININHIDATAAATYVDDFYVRADGYTYIPDGYLSTKNHSVGGKGIEIHEANIDFYDWTKKDNFIGTILAGVIGKDSSDARGAIAILCDDGDRVQIGRRRGVSASSYDSAITVNGDDELGIEFYGNVKGHGQKGACFYVNSAGLTNFAITNQENTIYGNCELSVYGTQRLKYELYVEGNIHGNVISTSDKNVKKDIKALDIEDSAHFIYSLIPSEFRFKNGTSNRLHHGLIAQEVKKSMGDSDWGLFIDKKVDNENYIETEVNSETGEQTQLLTARYGLRYDELIADLIATVQSLNNRLKALEK